MQREDFLIPRAANSTAVDYSGLASSPPVTVTVFCFEVEPGP